MSWVIQHSGFGVFTGWKESPSTFETIPGFSREGKLTDGRIFYSFAGAEKHLKQMPSRWRKAYITELKNR